MTNKSKELKARKFVFDKVLLDFPGHLFWKDLAGLYLGCNQSQAEAYGVSSPAEVIGKTDYQFMPKEEAEIFRSNDLKVVESGQPLTVEECGFLSMKSPLRDEQDNVIGIIGIAIRIQDYKTKILNKELSYEKLLAALPGHIYWKDRSGRFLGCNDEQAFDVGFKSRKDVIGKSTYELVYQNQPEYEKRIQAGIIDSIDRKVMESGEAELLEEFVMTPNNTKLDFLSRKTPLRNDKDEVIGLLGVSLDITSIKQREKELMEAKEKAELANNMKSEFIYNMRHDLRTPFCGILGIAELLESEESDPAKKENLGYIKQSSRILLDQLDKIFEFIHVEHHSLPITEKSFNLHKVVDELKVIMAPIAKGKGLQFIVSHDANVPADIIGDELRTTRILMNLVSNALRFTDQGDIAVHLSVVGQEGREVVIKFTISDTGVGVSQEQQRALFEKIHFSHYSKVFSTNGLGFKIVKAFLNDLGGDIYLNTEEGKGSVFTVLVPYKLPLLESVKK